MENKLWDELASDYDASVENNKTLIIVNYLKKEIEILSSICSNIVNSNKNSSIIDMGAGTGRVIFALDKLLKNDSVKFFGVEVSEPMINRSLKKNQIHNTSSSINFLKHDITESNLAEKFSSAEPCIVMCLYNTLGVIPSNKRQMFVDNMRRIAGHDGLTIITAFNGDDFGFVAPKLYNAMMPMIRQIDGDSFDEKNKLFKNSLGFKSQWFSQNELKSLLRTEVDPIPIKIELDGESRIFGNVFLDRKIK